jgi:hypothetical protein
MSSTPKSPERLEKRLARVAREQGIDQERLRHWVSFLALCGVLEKAMHEGVLGAYYLKGGVAMELRFALRARATKDLDLGIEGNRTSRMHTLSDVLVLRIPAIACQVSGVSAQWFRRENPHRGDPCYLDPDARSRRKNGTRRRNRAAAESAGDDDIPLLIRWEQPVRRLIGFPDCASH